MTLEAHDGCYDADSAWLDELDWLDAVVEADDEGDPTP